MTLSCACLRCVEAFVNRHVRGLLQRAGIEDSVDVGTVAQYEELQVSMKARITEVWPCPLPG
jgi:hypothetical protein